MVLNRVPPGVVEQSGGMWSVMVTLLVDGTTLAVVFWQSVDMLSKLQYSQTG